MNIYNSYDALQTWASAEKFSGGSQMDILLLCKLTRMGVR